MWGARSYGLVLALVASAAASDPPPTGPCIMADAARRDAWDGEWPLNYDEATRRGFCWAVHEVPGVPWAYHKGSVVTEDDECAAAAAAPRRECAVSGKGVNEDSCLQRGCCWLSSAVAGDPWCFFPAGEGYDEDDGDVSPQPQVASSSSSSSAAAGKRHQQLETAFAVNAADGAAAPAGVREHTEGFGSGESLLPQVREACKQHEKTEGALHFPHNTLTPSPLSPLQRVAAWRTPAGRALRRLETPPLSSAALPSDAPASDRNAAWQVGTFKPLAPSDTVVTSGSARFTVLSTGLVRAEWSPATPPRFNDAASMAVVNRDFDGPSPSFTVVHDSVSSGSVVIETTEWTLTYEPARGAHAREGFTSSTLKLRVRSTGSVWTPGAAATGSLHGTIRTLDRIGSPLSLVCRQPAYVNDTHCVEGVLSRDGWSFLDDSLGARWENLDQAWPWTTGPAEEAPWVDGGASRDGMCAASGFDRYQCIHGNRVDRNLCLSLGCCFDAGAADTANGHAAMWNYVPWCYHPTPPVNTPGYTDFYVFARGRDYKGTLRDFKELSGPVPLLPRYSLGPMFSRWMAYHDWEEREVVDMYARNGVPLDVMIVDMDWVRTSKTLCVGGGRFVSNAPSPPPPCHTA